MQKQEEFYVNSRFNFGAFLSSSFLSDCELRIYNSGDDITTIRAHRYVLSNSSHFFFNIFTSGMQEESTGIVVMKKNPDNMLQKVIRWMYDGEIRFDWEDVVALLEISQYYSIPQLNSDVMKFLDTNINEKNVLVLVRKCYELELDDILDDILNDYLALFFRKIPIQELSDELDVFEFAKVVKKVNLGLEEEVRCIMNFIGDYETNDQEKNILMKIFDNNTAELKEILENNNINWLPDSFIKSLK